MAFNHYSKIHRILTSKPVGWYVMRVDSPMVSQNFKGESVRYNHYYRIFNTDC